MKYFIVDREIITEDHWKKAEPLFLSALGTCCGQFTVLVFKDENVPEGFTNPMTEEEFYSFAIKSDQWPKEE